MESGALRSISSVYVRPVLDRRPQDVNMPLFSRYVQHRHFAKAASKVDVRTTSQES